ncbi:MAG: aldehyde dehydrogenase family protein [Myxococcales bacterium]|nr:aldehyde dehydrogenase family protein [Myxococcales bacterium]
MKLALPHVDHRTGYWDGRHRTVAVELFEVVDPATAEQIAVLPMMDATHATEAVQSAVRALEAGPLDFGRRSEILLAIADVHRVHSQALAAIVTAENGMPIAQAEAEVESAASIYIEAERRLEWLSTRTLETRPESCTWQVHARPAGVGALITSRISPLVSLARRLASALAAGCPVVIKPSEAAPLSTISLFAHLHGMELPPGLLNLVFGKAGSICRVFCEHPEVRVVSFSGPSAIGEVLLGMCAPRVKRLSLESEANAPFLVFGDADLDVAADQLVQHKMRVCGQTRVAANRVLIEASVLDDFVRLVTDRVDALQTGPGADPATDVGPLIDRRSLERVVRHVDDALCHGAQVVSGGDVLSDVGNGGGHFFAPTVLVGATHDMACFMEDTLGPLIAIGTFEGECEAIAAAERAPHGLAAYVFSEDQARLGRMAGRLRVGHVGLNTAVGPTCEAPFGAIGNAGMGRQGGDEGILEFIEWQTTPIGKRGPYTLHRRLHGVSAGDAIGQGADDAHMRSGGARLVR